MAYENLKSIRPGRLLADTAYAQLSEGILRNELPPGTSLAVRELSQQLGISRSPVREAVQRLIYDGLADYRGRRGTVVSSIGISEFVALLDVREVLEGLAARMAVGLATNGELEQLEQHHNEFSRITRGSDGSTSLFVEHDMTFHRLIREMTRNKELATILGRSQARAHLSMHSLWVGGQNVEAVRSEHGDICASIVARDPDQAAAAAQRHIAALRARTLAEIDDRGVSHDELATCN